MTRQMLSTVSKGQAAVMALDEPAHHVRFPRRPKSRTGFLAFLDRDQLVDDPAALDQQRMHRLIDAVDFSAQVGERRGVLVRRFCHA